MRLILTLVVVVFCLFCGWLVIESGLFEGSQTQDAAFGVAENSSQAGQVCILLQKTTSNEKSGAANVPTKEAAQVGAATSITFGADNAPVTSVTLGSVDPKSGFKFQLELSSKGAAIRKAIFSEFNDRDYKDPQPLVIISPVQKTDGSEVLAMANKELILVEHQLQLRLQDLHWKSFDKETAEDGSQIARFEAVIKIEGTNEPVLKLIKTYKVIRGSYILDCNIAVENLSAGEQTVSFNLTGPVGIGKEAVRSDMRNVVAGFLTKDNDGHIISSRKDLLVGFPMNIFKKDVGLRDTTRAYEKALQIGDQAEIKKAKRDLQIGRNLPRAQQEAHFLWAAASNKYFTAILRPVPDDGEYCDWVADKTGWYYNPDGDKRGDTGDETIGVDLKIGSRTVPLIFQPNSAKEYNFQLYLGPKNRDLFRANELYKKLGFVNTVTFMPCCCCPFPGIIRWLAFIVLTIMNWMYSLIGNYGWVIIILVFLMRLAMHPLTKKSQVSMSRMSKLAPKTEEIKKKYANNKAEMNKQLMALYKEQGASPIMGFLPMMVQMPIWIALWSAVSVGIELRGKPFLPFWITDLSVPDALYRFPTPITVPLLGWKIMSLNLLPILMGVAFYLQQKLMPKQAAAATSPQAAQQQQMQKTMMIMMPLMFPLMLYKAPSGVNLYIMASTFAGVIEQYVIKKHIREKEEAESRGLVAATSKTGGKVKKKKPKPFYKT